MDAYRIKACGIALSWRDLEDSVPALIVDDLMLMDQSAAKASHKSAKKAKRSPRGR